MPFRARSLSAALYAALAGHCGGLADIYFILEKPGQRYIFLGLYTSGFPDRIFLFISLVRVIPIGRSMMFYLFGFSRRLILYVFKCSDFPDELKTYFFNDSEFPEEFVQLISINRDFPNDRNICFQIFGISRRLVNDVFHLFGKFLSFVYICIIYSEYSEDM